MSQDFNGVQRGAMKEDVKQSIVQLGLDYRLMTQFTSFVAVEEMIVTDGGQPRRIDVPIEVPEGVNREATYGEAYGNRPMGLLSYSGGAAFGALPAVSQTVIVTSSGTANTKAPARSGVVGGGIGTGSGGGSGGGGSASAPAPIAMRAIMDEPDIGRRLSPEEKQRAELQSKFHPSVLAVIDRLKARNAIAGADESKFIRNGKAEIQIWFTDKSAETMAKLKELGFEVILDPKTAKMVIGRLPIEKLPALAELKSVRYVAPQVSAN
jgi:hypothetical protein